MISSLPIFKNFKINVIIRFTVIILLIFALAYTLLETDLWTLIFWLSIAIVLFIIDFIRYVEKFKEHFIYFLQAINQEDFTLSFQETNKQRKDEKFSKILNEITGKFRELRAEKESRHQYLKTVMDHINIGLISYNQDGEITLMNRAAGEILQKPHLRRIESLGKIDKGLYEEVLKLSSEKKSLVKMIHGNKLWHLSLQATEMKLDEGYEKVIAMQDIKNELDEQEIESWQKLVRVINHEIMNSVIPISTLASVLDQMLSDLDMKEQENELIKDVADGVKTIDQRSKGLANFVKATKSLTQISRPVFKSFNVEVLFTRVNQLLSTDMEKHGVALIIHKPEEKITLLADFELIEQVLINLIKNAREAYENDNKKEKVILVSAEIIDKQTMISVSDFGLGIDKEMLDQIFIPFFTTKKEGSGIGLPLSRQIMRLHKGTLEVKSVPGEGATFVMIF
jgi:nitrogen fixation/metabolism regulation signal transduction histidine kinase